MSRRRPRGEMVEGRDCRKARDLGGSTAEQSCRPLIRGKRGSPAIGRGLACLKQNQCNGGGL